MEKWLSDISPIMGVEHDCIVSRQGDITIAFKVRLPEIFSMSDVEYEVLHQSWVKAIRLLPRFTVVHRQDWFVTKKYVPVGQKGFLAEAAGRYFQGRPYLDHMGYLYITKKVEGRKPASSMFSNLFAKSIVPAQVLERAALDRLNDKAGQFKKVLESSGLIKLQRLTDEELASVGNRAGAVESYLSLTPPGDGVFVKDIDLSDGIRVGNKYVQLFTLADVNELPSLCGSRITYDRFSTDRTKFSVGFASSLGQLLNCDHIYNQFIFIEDERQTIKKLESKKLRLQSLSAYSRENSISRDAVDDFLNEAISMQRLPVKAHFNVMVWSDNREELKETANLVSAALAQMDAIAKEETVGAAQVFWSGIPGNAADFPSNDTFDTFLEQATCFLNCEGSPRSVGPDQGIRFCDRLSSRPLFFDLFDGPRHAGISSNMGVLCVGSSGGGKSMTINHLVNSLFIQGAHCLIVDIGGSYRGLCELNKGYYFTYEENNPINFNPFYLSGDQVLDTEKKESLKTILYSLWKQEGEEYRRSEYVAISNALAAYYKYLGEYADVFPSFNSFYEYLQGGYVELLREQKVKDRDFDIDNFLYVLRPYYKGGEFDYLLNATENLEMLDQPFIVFELDNIKDNVILFGVVTLIVVELFMSKIRGLKGVRKVLCIDEAWKAIAKTGMAEFLKYAFKTIRKHNGVPIVVTQELDDLVSSPLIKDAIINNADIKILMDMRKYLNKFDGLQQTLGLSEKGKTNALSVNKDDRDIFIDIGGQIQMVYRNELCPEERLAYTTEGRERVKVIEAAQKHGSMEAGIAALLRDG